MKEKKPIGGRIFTTPFLICLGIALIALYFLAKRFIFGLGAVTNMNDGYPWGIWIAYDVVVGTAFGCGGYAMALLVYIFNKGEYHPLVRPAVMTSVFGYSLAAVAVFFDIGRYWNMYNIFLPWYANTNSVLLEVALCIAAYCLVLWIEFSPTFVKTEQTKAKLNKVMFIFIALGILLPTMHQSSLGTMMIAAGQKLSPLWWTGLLPLLFLISAITMGYAVVIFESSIATLRYKLADETDILGKLSSIMPWLLGAYLIVRFGDVIVRGHFGLIFKGDLLGNMFILENILLIIPMCLLAVPGNRKNARLLFLSAVSLILSGGIYRFNCYIIGFNPGTGWHYFPAVPEIFITLGLVSVELMAYLWFIKRLPIYRSA